MDNSEDAQPSVLAFINGCLITLSFLTRIPVRATNYDKSSWRWSPAFFPLAGTIIGFVAVLPLLIPFLISKYFHLGFGVGFELCTPFLYLVLTYWMNRMLHLDGFCDCCDGFSAMVDSSDRRLEIMKDPCVGSSAAGAAILLIGGKGLVLFLLVWFNGATVRADHKTIELLAMLIAAPAFARLSIVALAFRARYPRESGTGSVIVGNVSVVALLCSVLSMAPVFYFVSLSAIKVSVCMIALCVIYWRTKANNVLGGVTGDVLGACCETAELAVLIGFLMVF